MESGSETTTLCPFNLAISIAETVGDRLKRSEGVDIGLLLRGVHASGSEGNGHGVTGILRRLLDADATGQHDGQRGKPSSRLAARC